MKLYTVIAAICLTLIACSSKEKSPEAHQEKPAQAAIDENEGHNLVPDSTAPDHKTAHPNWSYSGLTGPEMWGDMKPEYKLCKSGKLQSPIDLIWSRPQTKSEIRFAYNESDYQMIDNGHTIKATFSPGNKIWISGKEYNLVQMHFNSESEHTISVTQYHLEDHFVHKNDKGELAVLGVLFVEGNTNPYLESMWQQLPSQKNRSVASTVRFNPRHLIPQIMTHYNYSGSLTTPPCSEGVNWNVFNTPLELSSEQLNHFRVLYANNYRPVQPTNSRRVVNH